jgi:nucleoside-diphosphate-sugar epimerase
MEKYALVCSAGGFIGNHLISRLKNEVYWVNGVDLKYLEYSEAFAADL